MDGRQRILAAALPLVDEHGPVAVSAEEIRVRAGVSVGSLYHHFPGGKSAIITGLLDEWLCHYQTATLTVLRPHTDITTAVPAVVTHFVEWVLAHPAAARVLLRFEHESRAPCHQPRRTTCTTFGDQVAAWLERYGPRGDQPAPLAVMLAVWVGPAKEYARGWLHGRGTDDPDAVVPVLATTALHALRPLRLRTGPPPPRSARVSAPSSA